MKNYLSKYNGAGKPGFEGIVINTGDFGVLLRLPSGKEGLLPAKKLEEYEIDISSFEIGERFTVFPARKGKSGKREDRIAGYSVFSLKYMSNSGKRYLSDKLYSSLYRAALKERNTDSAVTSMEDYSAEKKRLSELKQKARQAETDGAMELALHYHIHLMATCLERLKEREDDSHYFAFLDSFPEYLRIKNEYSTSSFIDLCFSIISRIEQYEAECPGNGSIMTITMTVLDQAAYYAMKIRDYVAAAAIYDHQRDKLVGYSDFISYYDALLAGVDKKMIMPCLLAGQTEKARTVGEEAYKLLEELCADEPEEYAADLIEVCANLSGIYMEAVETEALEKVYSSGLAVWQAIPEELQSCYNIVLAKSVLDQNNNIMKKKRLNDDMVLPEDDDQ